MSSLKMTWPNFVKGTVCPDKKCQEIILIKNPETDFKLSL
jgi:hypothetical protein